MSEEWKKLPKLLLDALTLIVIGLPAAVIGYVWQAVKAGLALGEWAFDPDAFYRRYGGHEKTDELIRGLRETFRK